MKQWVEKAARSVRYSNTSEYIRNLIRRDQEQAEQAMKIAHIQALVTEGIESGAGKQAMEA